MGCEVADRNCHVRGDRGEHVVVVRLDPQHPRLFRRPEADRERRAERDRHLAEDVTRLPRADDALAPIGDPHRLDPAGEHREERAI
jgi:hypothetical protein